MFALVACKGDKPAPTTGSGSNALPPVAADAAPPPPRPAIDAAPPPATFNQQLTPDGVGPLTADTDVATLEKIFPGLTVKVEHDEGEDHSIDHHAFSAGTSHAFDVVVDNYLDKTHAFRVDVWTGLFATRDNIRVGSTVAELLAKDDSIACKRESYEPNAEHFEHALFCESQRLPNLAFYLDDKALPGTDGKVVLAKLAQMKFIRIIWKNPKVKAP
ncbi:MAG: hypothetical protein ABI678_20685 [Kofleriaceae bacterium]